MAIIGYRAEIDAGRRFIQEIEPGENIVLLFSGDADGCSAGAIMYRTLLHMGNQLVFPAFMEKDETIYSDNLIKRIQVRDPSRLIVMGEGSSTRAIIPGLTTMVIDHHQPEGVPPVDVFVTSYGVEPPASTSMLAYEICRELVQLDGLEWLAAIGAAGDFGPDADIEILRNARDRYGADIIREVSSLMGAARHDIATAFGALVDADSPLDIVEGASPEAVKLVEYRMQE